MSELSPKHCQRHPETETRLLCSRCEDPICSRCLVQTPVGARCPTCAGLRQLPMFEMDSKTYLRSLGAGLGLALALGGLWGLLFFDLYRLPFLPLLAPIGVGYAMGEGIGAAVNRKRGKHLQYIAGGCVGLGFLVAGVVEPLVFVVAMHDLLLLLMLGVAVFVAAGRLN